MTDLPRSVPRDEIERVRDEGFAACISSIDHVCDMALRTKEAEERLEGVRRLVNVVKDLPNTLRIFANQSERPERAETARHIAHCIEEQTRDEIRAIEQADGEDGD